MFHILKRIHHCTAKFLDTIEVEIAKIHSKAGVDNATVVQEINDAITACVTPLQDQITELQTALTDVVAKLNAGDTAGALEVAQAAATTDGQTTENGQTQ